MRLTKLIAAPVFLAISGLTAAAQVPTPNQAAPAPKPPTPVVNTGKPGLVRLINTASFREGIQELKSKRDRLNTEFEPRNVKIKGLQEQITALQTELQAQSPNMTPQAREDKTRRLEKLQIDYKYEVDTTNSDASRRWQEETRAIFEKLDKFFGTYAAQRNITIVLDIAGAVQSQLLLYAAPGLDITKEFMDEYNRAHPVAGANPPAPSTTPKR